MASPIPDRSRHRQFNFQLIAFNENFEVWPSSRPSDREQSPTASSPTSTLRVEQLGLGPRRRPPRDLEYRVKAPPRRSLAHFQRVPLVPPPPPPPPLHLGPGPQRAAGVVRSLARGGGDDGAVVGQEGSRLPARSLARAGGGQASPLPDDRTGPDRHGRGGVRLSPFAFALLQRFVRSSSRGAALRRGVARNPGPGPGLAEARAGPGREANLMFRGGVLTSPSRRSSPLPIPRTSWREGLSIASDFDSADTVVVASTSGCARSHTAPPSSASGTVRTMWDLVLQEEEEERKPATPRHATPPAGWLAGSEVLGPGEKDGDEDGDGELQDRIRSLEAQAAWARRPHPPAPESRAGRVEKAGSRG
ncbi:hypothetical protein F5X96DRAFT_673680 [Biscogniauxia mediterranea]|nr:hypothetical protein F5X96DRAFT_673680 [Biscogniauxia mediterranea]